MSSDLPGWTGCLTPTEHHRSVALQRRWQIECELADRVAWVLTAWERENGRSADVSSGYRTRASQDALRSVHGAYAAREDRSNHRVYPARAVDVTLGALPTADMKASLHQLAYLAGLRVGGGAPNPDGFFGREWNHLDLGPRPEGMPSGHP